MVAPRYSLTTSVFRDAGRICLPGQVVAVSNAPLALPRPEVGLAPSKSAGSRSHAINIRDILPIRWPDRRSADHESLAAGSRVLDLHFQKNTIVFRSIHAPVIAAARRVGNIGKELGHS